MGSVVKAALNMESEQPHIEGRPEQGISGSAPEDLVNWAFIISTSTFHLCRCERCGSYRFVRFLGYERSVSPDATYPPF